MAGRPTGLRLGAAGAELAIRIADPKLTAVTASRLMQMGANANSRGSPLTRGAWGIVKKGPLWIGHAAICASSRARTGPAANRGPGTWAVDSIRRESNARPVSLRTQAYFWEGRVGPCGHLGLPSPNYRRYIASPHRIGEFLERTKYGEPRPVATVRPDISF